MRLKWKKNYSFKEEIMDGTSWSVEFITNNSTYNSNGSNAYPKGWETFCKLISGSIGQDFS